MNEDLRSRRAFLSNIARWAEDGKSKTLNSVLIKEEYHE